jgi:hypothetical protein
MKSGGPSPQASIIAGATGLASHRRLRGMRRGSERLHHDAVDRLV